MTEKDKKIIEDAERDGIPIFVLTAKDVASVSTLLSYKDICKWAHCRNSHICAVGDRIAEFIDWQRDNSDKVKLAG